MKRTLPIRAVIKFRLKKVAAVERRASPLSNQPLDTHCQHEKQHADADAQQQGMFGATQSATKPAMPTIAAIVNPAAMFHPPGFRFIASIVPEPSGDIVGRSVNRNGRPMRDGRSTARVNSHLRKRISNHGDYSNTIG